MKMKSFDLRRQLLVICMTFLGILISRVAAAEDQPSSSGFSKSRKSRSSIERWELRVAPLPAFFRFYSAEFAYRFSNKWSLGPSVVVYDSPGDLGNMLGPTYHGASVGINSTYYFKSAASDTPYISGRAFYQSYTAYGHASRGYSENAGGRGEAIIGFQWRWNSASMRSGVGFQYENEQVRNITSDSGNLPAGPDIVETSRRNSLFPTIELKLGIEI